MMYSTYKLNKHGDNIQPCCIPFPILNQSFVPCPVLTVASRPAYRFLRRQVMWSGTPNSKNFPHLFVIYTVKGFSVVSEAEVDVFLEFPCFLCGPMNVDNLISGSSDFYKSSFTSGSSCFTYCWSLAWRILSITWLACEMSAIIW